jgi:rhamnulokinase
MLDPDDPRFLSPADMPAAIASWFRGHGQPAPEGIGLITRAIYDSIALNHRHTLDALATPDAGAIEEINLVGGGVLAPLLSQATADATGSPVIAGPQEATVRRKHDFQLIAEGGTGGLEEGRAIVRRSTDLTNYRETAYAPSRSREIVRQPNLGKF